MTQGWLGIECSGVERVIGAKDGEVRFQKGEHHRLFPHFGREGGGEDGEKKTVFMLSGEESGEVFQLDTVFFQNWYGYQDRFVKEGRGPSLVQVMSVSFSPFSIIFFCIFLFFSFGFYHYHPPPFFLGPLLHLLLW